MWLFYWGMGIGISFVIWEGVNVVVFRGEKLQKF